MKLSIGDTIKCADKEDCVKHDVGACKRGSRDRLPL